MVFGLHGEAFVCRIEDGPLGTAQESMHAVMLQAEIVMQAARAVLWTTNSRAFLRDRFSLPAGSGVTSKRRLRLYSASLPKMLKSGARRTGFLSRLVHFVACTLGWSLLLFWIKQIHRRGAEDAELGNFFAKTSANSASPR